jgi:hypothetical protein
MAAIIRLINFKAIGILLRFTPVSLAGRVERTAIGAFNLEAEGLLVLNLIPQL